MNVRDIVSEDVRGAIRAILEGDMEPFGLCDVRVTPGEDHDGDPVLLIDADYRASGRPIDPKVLAGLVTKLRDRLWNMGETRFPHIRHHIPEQRSVAGT
ncbi:MAG: hypothetical protein WD673_01020 [Alphaproteobacteria bacterium]